MAFWYHIDEDSSQIRKRPRLRKTRRMNLRAKIRVFSDVSSTD